MKLIFTDIDGTKYYEDANGDIVDKHGQLVSLTTEFNIRAWMAQRTIPQSAMFEESEAL